MATFRKIFRQTRFLSLSSAQKSDKTKEYVRYNNSVFVNIYEGRYAGKIKEFTEKNKIGETEQHTDYNGYGYSTHEYNYFLSSVNGKKLLIIINGKTNVEKSKTWEEIRDAWARQLVKKSDNKVTFDVACMIAEDKQGYKIIKIDELRRKQVSRYSQLREKFIKRMERENPLRRIKNYEHAISILIASNRHNNTNYDNILSYAHELEEIGEIEKGTAKEYARKQIKGWHRLAPPYRIARFIYNSRNYCKYTEKLTRSKISYGNSEKLGNTYTQNEDDSKTSSRLVKKYDHMTPTAEDMEQVTRNYAAYIVECAEYEIERAKH